MTIALSLLVCILGLLIYLISNNPQLPKLSEVGRLMFFAGLLAFLLRFTADMLPHLQIGGRP